MQYLTAEDILRIHSAIIDETGGAHGLRDKSGLAACIDLPHQSAFGKELYPTLFLKAAVYTRNIIYAHPFIDGNKRTAMAAADVFLQLNGSRVDVAAGGIESFALRIIAEHLELVEIASWLEKQSR